MMRLLSLIFCLFLGVSTYAQTLPSDIFLDNQSKPYLEHTVGAKENFYSIGRMYNLSPKVLAPYNKLDLAAGGLSIGQKLRIPLVETNFWQSGTRTSQEVVIPLYYKLTTPANISAIAEQFGTVAAELKSWNQGLIDNLKKDTRLIVGFLKVDKTLSPLASKGVSPRKEPTVVVNPQPEVKTKEVNEGQPEKIAENKTVATYENKTNPSVKKDTAVALKYEGEGFFKNEYEAQINSSSETKTESGSGSVFKSTSGWSDGKYYLIIDGIERGTIVLLKHVVTGKIIYAKVLSNLQEVKPNASERFILSEAGAAQLGVKANGFSAEIFWSIE